MHSIIEINVFSDSRGVLKKVFMKSELEKIGMIVEESYSITFNKQNIVRGEHFHEKTIEIFHVLQGECNFELVENNKIITIKLDSKENKAIMVMPNTPHRIIAKKDNSVVIAISSKEYREDETDTYPYNFENISR